MVMTSALHAEGREFNPRSEHNIFYWKFGWCSWLSRQSNTLEVASSILASNIFFLYLAAAAKTAKKKKVEEQGIDPCASRMLSVRSTI